MALDDTDTAPPDLAKHRKLVTVAIMLATVMQTLDSTIKRLTVCNSVMSQQKSKRYFWPNPVNISCTSASNVWASRAL